MVCTYELFLSCNCELVSVIECDEIEQANGHCFDRLEVCTCGTFLGKMWVCSSL